MDNKSWINFLKNEWGVSDDIAYAMLESMQSLQRTYLDQIAVEERPQKPLHKILLYNKDDDRYTEVYSSESMINIHNLGIIYNSIKDNLFDSLIAKGSEENGNIDGVYIETGYHDHKLIQVKEKYYTSIFDDLPEYYVDKLNILGNSATVVTSFKFGDTTSKIAGESNPISVNAFNTYLLDKVEKVKSDAFSNLYKWADTLTSGDLDFTPIDDFSYCYVFIPKEIGECLLETEFSNFSNVHEYNDIDYGCWLSIELHPDTNDYSFCITDNDGVENVDINMCPKLKELLDEKLEECVKDYNNYDERE